MDDIKKQKAESRKIILFKRRGLPKEIWEKNSALIFNSIISHSWYKMADYVLLYINDDNEPDTRGLIIHALSKSKKVYAPVIDLDNNDMDFYRLDNISFIRPGAFGIGEPPADAGNIFEPCEKPGIMIVPGVEFDRNGHRLGRGGGFYDRYLERLVENSSALGIDLNIKTIAPVFSFQIGENVPSQEHDKKVDCLITEKGVIHC